MIEITEDSKLKKLELLISVLENNVSKNEFINSFKIILDMVAEIKKQNKETIENLKDNFDETTDKYNEIMAEYNGIISKIRKNQDVNFDELKNKTDKLLKLEIDRINKEKEENINKLWFEHESLVSIIEKKLLEVKNGEKGLDGKDGSPDDAFQIRDKLESLEEQDKLKIKDIKDLEKTLNELRNRERRYGGGGGFSYLAMSQHIIDDESLVGTINGVNKEFTIASIPNPSGSLKIYRGGTRQRVTEDYTISGRTITFIIAPVTGEILLADYRT